MAPHSLPDDSGHSSVPMARPVSHAPDGVHEEPPCTPSAEENFSSSMIRVSFPKIVCRSFFFPVFLLTFFQRSFYFYYDYPFAGAHGSKISDISPFISTTGTVEVKLFLSCVALHASRVTYEPNSSHCFLLYLFPIISCCVDRFSLLPSETEFLFLRLIVSLHNIHPSLLRGLPSPLTLDWVNFPNW